MLYSFLNYSLAEILCLSFVMWKNVYQHNSNIDYNQKKLEGATNSVGGAVDFMTYLVALAIKLS